MYKVKKTLTDSCFLACIESYLLDNNIEYIDQKYMVQKLSAINLCSGTGVVQFDHIKCACRVINIELNEVKYHFPIHNNYNDGALLIGTSKGNNHHCVRYYKQEEEAKIIVMDPESGDYMIYDKPGFDSGR
jgi:hypothetical protein